MLVIKEIKALEILDSRSEPTLKVFVTLSDGVTASAQVPSGASKGKFEAYELRDGGARYGGRGVRKAVKNVNQVLAAKMKKIQAYDQKRIDQRMIELDGTPNKRKLGANAILGVSLACARTAAISRKLPLYRSLRNAFCLEHRKYPLPLLMMNILNGGKHADNGLDIQEYMIVPSHALMRERVRMGSEVYHSLKRVLVKKRLSTGVGDEGGFAPVLKGNQEAFDLLAEAIRAAGYRLGKDMHIAIDAAATSLYKKGGYVFEKKKKSAADLIALYRSWINAYKLMSVEDGLSENDWEQWERMTQDIGDRALLVGDDLFVTNVSRIRQGIERGVANAVLIKPNQIGTLTETVQAACLAQEAGYQVVVSHRSGETTDDSIADLAVALQADFIKAGAPARGERVAKYNRLLEIEQELKS